MFGSSNRIIIQKQTSKTKQKLATKHKTKLLLVIPVLWPEPCIQWVKWTEEKKHRHGSVNLKRRSTVMDLWIWREEAPSWICESEEKKHRHGSVNLKRRSTVMDLWIWREEAPSWICESEGSGVILDEGMVSDLLSGVLLPHQAL